MRIIAGKSKGAILVPIKGLGVRPTLERIRESLFNIITPYLVEDCVFLDLFAGTGVNGLEALSRGVRKSIFVDSAPASLNIVRKNAEKLRIIGDCTIIRGAVPAKLGSIGRQFKPVEVVYADPPFDYPDYVGLLSEIDASGVVAADGIVLVEHGAKRDLPPETGKLVRYREQEYGRTVVSFYRNGSADS
jgi:16S rRNA (guanine966-N2)-methyltransferase